MTTDKQIELIDELADKCCRDHDIHKSCMACWRRTQGCSKFITIAKLVQEGCRIVPTGEWIDVPDYGGSGWQISGKPVQPKYCSVCGDTYSKAYNYCPNCGAKMMER